MKIYSPDLEHNMPHWQPNAKAQVKEQSFVSVLRSQKTFVQMMLSCISADDAKHMYIQQGFAAVMSL